MDDNLQQQGEIIAKLINGIENQLTAAYATAAQLNVAATEFAAAARVTHRAGQPVLAPLSQLLTAIAEGRGAAIEAHRHIERIGKMAQFGDGEPKPKFFEGAEQHLTVVAEAA